jgi:hypothetical protein
VVCGVIYGVRFALDIAKKSNFSLKKAVTLNSRAVK